MRLNALAVFLSLAVSTLCLSQAAQAVPLTFNVDGVVTDGSNNPLEAAAVTFQIDIRDPRVSGSCLLYREQFNVDMTGSNGYFSIVLGKVVPPATKANLVTLGETLDKVFSNLATSFCNSCKINISLSFNSG